MEKELIKIKYELQDLIDKYAIEDIYITIQNKLNDKKVVFLNVSI